MDMIIAKRNYRSSWRPGEPLEGPNEGSYTLTAVCLWSVVGAIMATLLAWLALGGELYSN
jgi:hypothetical protein